MTRVLLAIDSYRISGPAKGLLDFCECARAHLEPLVVVFQRGRPDRTEFRDECQRRGIHVEVVRERHRYDLSVVSQTLRVARAFKPDLVQTHGYKADVIGLAVRWRLGIPWVTFNHGWTQEGTRMRLYHALDDLLIHGADRIVAVSEAQKAAFQARGYLPARLFTIHNGITMPRAAPAEASEVRQELGLHDDHPVVAAVGRLSPEKGQSYFVEAMTEIVRAVPLVRGLIVGEGQDEARLRAQVSALRLGEVIKFVGYRRDMDRIYAAIDLLVLPSLSEGLPNVVLEAMAHGRPVVATRVGGVPEIVEDGVSGILVAAGDAPALARAVGTILLAPGLRASMARAAQERVESTFSVRARAERILSLYSEILGSGSAIEERQDHARMPHLQSPSAATAAGESCTPSRSGPR